ncbi:MAG: alpha-galactosidase, partial [Phocaeicola sp.]|nr:alpha-galactosidase [Phocaeicola sp.]
MKEKIFYMICFLCISFTLKAVDKPVIKVSTDDIDLIYKVGNNGRLYQSYLGKKLNHNSDLAHLPQGNEAYLTHGMEDYFEPAVHVANADGNPSTLLKYVSHTQNQVSAGVEQVVITLQDDKYPLTVKLHYVAYQRENLIKT